MVKETFLFKNNFTQQNSGWKSDVVKQLSITLLDCSITVNAENFKRHTNSKGKALNR